MYALVSVWLSCAAECVIVLGRFAEGKPVHAREFISQLGVVSDMVSVLHVASEEPTIDSSVSYMESIECVYWCVSHMQGGD